MSKLLSKNKFYKIIDEIPPGNLKNKTEKLYFEKINLRGLDEMHDYSIIKEFYKYLEYRPFTKKIETEKYIKKLINLQKRNINGELFNISWFVRRKKDKKLIGTARLSNINYNYNSAEWGFGIDPRLWKYGHVYEIMNTIQLYSFNKLLLNRLWGATWKDNKRTISSIKLSGMIEEGIMRKALRDYKGKYHDVIIYGMLKKDFLKKNKIKLNTKKKYSENNIIEIVRSVLRLPKKTIIRDMETTKGWDSVSHFNIILSIEKKLNIKFTNQEISDSTSINNILKIIN